MKRMVSLLAAIVVALCAGAQSFFWTQTDEIPCRIIESDREGWQEVRRAQEGAHILEWPSEPVGAPAMPFRVVTFAVPDGCMADGVRVVCDIEWRTLGENVRLLPIQEPVTTDQIANAPFTEPNAAIYARKVWPETDAVAAPTYTASGVEVLPVRVNVLRYHPTTGLLEIATKVSLRVEFQEWPLASVRATALSESANEEVTRTGRINERLMSEVLDSTENGLVLSIVDTNTTYDVKYIVPSAMKSETPSILSSVSKASLPPVLETAERIDMVIISPPDFMELWQKYVAYRQETHPHLNIIIKNSDEIYRDFSGVDHAQKIHHYIEELVTYRSLQYVLLGAAAPGNSDRTLSTVYPLQTKYQIPTRYSCTDNSQPADLYYGCMDRIGGTGEVWDRQNDGLFMRTRTGADTAANCDLVPDLVVFRMPLRPTARDGANNRAISAAQQMDGFIAKLRACERWDFAGANRFLYSAAKMFDNATISKGANNDRVVSINMSKRMQRLLHLGNSMSRDQRKLREQHPPAGAIARHTKKICTSRKRVTHYNARSVTLGS